jgi:hypothetical protein
MNHGFAQATTKLFVEFISAASVRGRFMRTADYPPSRQRVFQDGISADRWSGWDRSTDAARQNHGVVPFSVIDPESLITLGGNTLPVQDGFIRLTDEDARCEAQRVAGACKALCTCLQVVYNVVAHGCAVLYSGRQYALGIGGSPPEDPRPTGADAAECPLLAGINAVGRRHRRISLELAS